jgi:hypothetical protein
MTTAEIIRNRMNRAMSSKGSTFVWNPTSKFNVRRKIKDVRLTFGGNIELTFFHPLPSKTSRLFTIEPTLRCMESFCIMNFNLASNK